MSHVIPGSPRWEQLVTQGILRDGTRNWFLGDAALEIVPIREETPETWAALRQYGDAIGVSDESLRKYRNVAAWWAPQDRVRAAWKVHHMLVGRKDLIRDGMTVTQASDALGYRNVGRTGPQADTASRVAAARDYLADPEVAREVMSDPDTARDLVAAAPEHIAAAQVERHRRIREQVAPPGSPEAQQREAENTRYEVLNTLERMIALRTAAAKLAGLGRITPAETEMLAHEAGLTLAAVQWLAALDPRGVDVSEDMADWLGGQE